MALTGSFNYYEYISDPDESNGYTSSISFPADLPSDHPDYDKRGTTEYEICVPTIATTSSYEGKYFYCSAASVHNVGGTIEGKNVVELTYLMKVYNSKDDKDSDFINNPIVTIDERTDWDWDLHTNPVEIAYNHFKTLDPNHSLVNN